MIGLVNGPCELVMSIGKPKFWLSDKKTETDLVFGISVEIFLVFCRFQNSNKF